MKIPPLLIALAFSWSSLLAPFTRPTNTGTAVKDGVKQFAKGKYPAAVESFSQAAKIRSSPVTSFDLGTAAIATGNRERGEEVLAEAMKDPGLRAAALYNRGNSALDANAPDRAIADYTAALRLAPGDRDTKRNLEIALRKREQQQKQQQQQGGGSSSSGQQQQKQNQQKQPQAGPRRGQQQGQGDVEALLRSIEQQEREELQRMRRGKGEQRRVGW